MRVRSLIPEKPRGTAVFTKEQVRASVVVPVPPGATPPHLRLLKRGAGRMGKVRELPVAALEQCGGLLEDGAPVGILRVGIDVAVVEEEVLPAVTIGV